MAYITKYGSFWGLVPQTSGNIYWVAAGDTYTVEGRAYSASDGNDGLSPERALRTLSQANSLVTASAHDIIVLLPGTHTVTAQVTLATAGVTVMGLLGGPMGHPHKKRTVLTSSASDETLGVTAANVTIANLHLVPVTQQAAIELADGADYFYLLNCSAEMTSPAAHTSTMIVQSIGTSSGLTNVVIENLYVETVGGQGPALDLNDVASGEIKGCTFRLQGSTAWADAVVSATGAVDVLFDDCKWISGTAAAITDPIDWTGNTTDGSAQLRNCYFSLSVGVLNGSADADFWVTSSSEISQTAAGGSAPVNVLNAG